MQSCMMGIGTAASILKQVNHILFTQGPLEYRASSTAPPLNET